MQSTAMRVCLITGIFPPDIGGPATYVPRIASALVDRGHRVSLISLSDTPGHDDSRYPFSVQRILRSQPKFLRVPRTVRAITAVARDSDLIFANGLFTESAIAAKLTRKSLVVKVVGDWAWERSVNAGLTGDALDEFQQRRYGLRIEALKWLRAAVTRQANIVFTPSHYLRRIVAGWGVSENRLLVIYNALEPQEEVEPASLPTFSGSTVLTIGRLVPWKGINRLIKVVAGLPNVRLVVVGDGPQRKALQTLARELEFYDRIIFTGSVPSSQIAGYLQAADVFVLNSTYEGLPHIVLEALQAGLPVIATDAGGTSEIVHHQVNGILIPPQDDIVLGAELRRLLARPQDRERLAASGQQHVKEHFQWDRLVDNVEALLLSVVS